MKKGLFFGCLSACVIGLTVGVLSLGGVFASPTTSKSEDISVKTTDTNVTISVTTGVGGGCLTTTFSVPSGTAISVEDNMLHIGTDTISANVANGYDFDQWNIPNSLNGGTVTQNVAISAQYHGTFTVTVQSSDTTQGTVNATTLIEPAGSIILAQGNQIVVGGTLVTATANANYGFDVWSNTFGVLTQNTTITASFTQYGLFNANGVAVYSWTQLENTFPSAFSDTNSDGIIDCLTGNGSSYLTTLSGKLVIPDKITSIVNGALKSCTDITSVTIPNTVTSIGEGAFYKCTSLTSISIPSSVISIGTEAFSDCSGLTSIDIPNSVTSIGDHAFQYCIGLTSITIGSGVTSVGDEAFYDCTGLTRVDITDIAAWCNIYFRKSDSNPLWYANHLYLNGTEVTNLVVSNTVTSIGKYAFNNCSGLTSITIPNSVTSIGNSAFYGTGLTSVTFDDPYLWYRSLYEGATTTALSSTDLANTSTAATYLKSTYSEYIWTKSSS